MKFSLITLYIFGLFSSSLLFLQDFVRYVFRPSSGLFQTDFRTEPFYLIYACSLLNHFSIFSNRINQLVTLLDENYLITRCSNLNHLMSCTFMIRVMMVLHNFPTLVTRSNFSKSTMPSFSCSILSLNHIK